MIRNQPHHLKQGEMAEAIAATFLQAKGLILLEKNFRCKHGEIDLIMLQGKVLVFIEVRLRSNSLYGGAAMSIDASKQNKLRRTAELFLQSHTNTYSDTACRFDVILMQSLNNETVEWIQNAF
jgi:putative endonuclease